MLIGWCLVLAIYYPEDCCSRDGLHGHWEREILADGMTKIECQKMLLDQTDVYKFFAGSELSCKKVTNHNFQQIKE